MEKNENLAKPNTIDQGLNFLNKKAFVFIINGYASMSRTIL